MYSDSDSDSETGQIMFGWFMGWFYSVDHLILLPENQVIYLFHVGVNGVKSLKVAVKIPIHHL